MRNLTITYYIAQNGIGVKVNHFWLRNNCEKWSGKNIFEIRELSQITFALRGGCWVGGQKNMLYIVYYIKVQTRDIHGQKMPKNANVICESSLRALMITARTSL